MKKVISVSITILMLTAVLHLSVATHYCGGTIAASMISFSGKLASCGMEADNQTPVPSGSYINYHCCDNVLVAYGINSTYIPSFSSVSDSYQHNFQILSIPARLAVSLPELIKSIYTSVNPPGASSSNSVALSEICVYRI